MNKVGIIGLGHVGATTALVMAQRGKVGKLVLLDKNADKVKSEQVDLQDQITQLDTNTQVEIQDYDAPVYDKLKDLDVLIFSAGNIGVIAEHGGNRDFELNLTSKIAKELAPKIKASGFNGVLLSITNPCDVIVRILQENTGLPKNQVFGTGTNLETARMHHAVANATGYDYHDIQGYVFGEHGDTMFPVWSSVRVAGQSIDSFNLKLDELTKDTVSGGYIIMNGKHYTSNGIATAANNITDKILSDSHQSLPVSAYDKNKKLYIGQLATIGKNGIEKIVPVPLTQKEKALYDDSAKAIQTNYDKVN